MTRLNLEQEAPSLNSFADTVAKLKQASETEGFPLVFEADLQARITAKGIDCEPTIVLGFCQAALASQALASDIRIVSQMPCRIAVYEREGKVTVSAMDASVLPLLYDGPVMSEIATQVRGIVTRMIDFATR